MQSVNKKRSTLIAMGVALFAVGFTFHAQGDVVDWSEDFSGATHSLNNEYDLFDNFSHDTTNDYLSVDWRHHSSARYWSAHDLSASETLTEQTSFALNFDIRMLTRVASDYAGVPLGRVGVFDVPSHHSELESASGVYFELAMGPSFTGSAYWQARGVVVDSDGNEYATSWRDGLLIDEPASDAGRDPGDELGGEQTYQVTLDYDADAQTLNLIYGDTTTTYSIALPEAASFTGNAVGVQTPFIGSPTGVLATGWVDSFTLVPEPASLAMLGLGATLILGGRRNRVSPSE